MQESTATTVTRHLIIGWLLSTLALWLLPSSENFQHLEASLQDNLVKIRAQTRTPNRDIIIIDVDDTSLNALAPLVGKWPWPRALHAELLEYILPQSPRAVVFDLLLSEEDHFRPDADRYLAEVISQYPDKIYLAALHQQLINPDAAPLLASYPANTGLQASASAIMDARGWLLLPRAIPDSLWQTGLINLTTDSDGIARRYPLESQWQGWLMPSLAARVAADLGADIPPQSTLGLDWLGRDPLSHPRLSYARVLSQARAEQTWLPDNFFHDRIIIIGTTAAGLHDLHHTPIANQHPGPFLLATALDNLLNAEQLTPLPGEGHRFIATLILIAMLMLFLRQHLTTGLLLALISVLLLALSAYLSVMYRATTMEVLPALMALTLFSLCAAGVNYWRYRQRYRATIEVFSHLLDPQVVNQLLAQEQPETALTSKTCQLTVLFMDIRNFTDLSESRSPGEVVSLLNHYFEAQVSTLFRHQATVDKFIGDAVMAFWGAPLEHDDQASLAIKAGLEMLDNLDGFKTKYGYKEFDIGIGIHTGPAVVGLVGTPQRYDYTAIGDSVNVASRIEGLTKGRAQLLVSEDTKIAAENDFEFDARGEFQVKGRREPVRVYEPKRATT